MGWLDCQASKQTKGSTVFDAKFTSLVQQACTCRGSKTDADLNQCLSDKKIFSDCNVKVFSATYTSSDGSLNEAAFGKLFNMGDTTTSASMALMHAVCDSKACFGRLNAAMNAMQKYLQEDNDSKRTGALWQSLVLGPGQSIASNLCFGAVIQQPCSLTYSPRIGSPSSSCQTRLIHTECCVILLMNGFRYLSDRSRSLHEPACAG